MKKSLKGKWLVLHTFYIANFPGINDISVERGNDNYST